MVMYYNQESGQMETFTTNNFNSVDDNVPVTLSITNLGPGIRYHFTIVAYTNVGPGPEAMISESTLPDGITM